ncbi:hypothetical protein B0H15DRAFT_796960 [Mycena belliarum]|uniref:DUF6532 domain-containing protein n=1 Tax=Mycena belliarum TaxID=1033014 RepID=A0AAD6UHH0_9AGAR|nr:hypothetical protein B0H15DRAFT_796960 [Mycena belliae]
MPARASAQSPETKEHKVNRTCQQLLRQKKNGQKIDVKLEAPPPSFQPCVHHRSLAYVAIARIRGPDYLFEGDEGWNVSSDVASSLTQSERTGKTMRSSEITQNYYRMTPKFFRRAESAPRRTLIRRVRRHGTPASSSPIQSQSPAPQPGAARTPLIHRTNLFGAGLHDDRQRPRQTAATVDRAVVAVEKENTHSLSSDEDEPSPPTKKSRKEPAARSIVNVAASRIPIVEAGYAYIELKVLTNEHTPWLNSRPDLAALSQEAFDYGVDKLGLDPDRYGPVESTVEQDLFRSQLYTARGNFKKIARTVVKGPNGYDFRQCANNTPKETQDAIAAHNRALVAVLLDKSAFVFTDPNDRTAKGTLYGHASIPAVIQRATFNGLLSVAMQHPEEFDDTLPEACDLEDETRPIHKPTYSLVAIAHAITALRACIMEYSSGHFVAEQYAHKIFRPHFEAELNTLRAWRAFTSKATVIPGNGPLRTTRPSFLTRTFQENLFANARRSVLKDIIAPVVPVAVMDISDFAGNQ